MKKIVQFLTQKSKANPWKGVIFSFSIIIPCLYLMINEIGDFNIEQVILILALILLIIFTKKLLDRIIDMSDEYEEYD